MLAVCDLISRAASFVWSSIANTAGDVAVNILSDIIFIALVAVVGIWWHQRSKGQKVRMFWGLKPHQPLKICLSDPRWHPTSKTQDGIERHQLGMGLVLPLIEYRAVQKIADHFRFLIPGTGDLPEAFKRLFFAEHDVQIIPATADSSWKGASSFVTIGSGAFNLASEEFEQRTNRTLSFNIRRRQINGGDELTLIGLKAPWKEFDRSTNRDGMLAIVAKASFETSTAFYCAGFDEVGSAGAAYFLANNWQALTDQFGSADFIVLLDFWGVQDFETPPVIRHKCEWHWRKA